jgi:preprotein translocase subunit SecB
VFVVELLYGGVFQITGVDAEDMEPVLLIECPRYLFPFARRIIADVTSEGGYPPFLLDPSTSPASTPRARPRPGQVVGTPE